MSEINIRQKYEPEWTHSTKQDWKPPAKPDTPVVKTDEELLAELKKLENWQDYALPEYWYDKFNIPKPEAVDMTTYIKENKWMKAWTAGGKSIKIIKEPQEYAANTPRGFVETAPLELKIVQTQGNYSDENPILARELATLQSASCKQPDSAVDSEIRPREDSTTNTQPVLDLQ
jgi:hypothetical protein